MDDSIVTEWGRACDSGLASVVGESIIIEWERVVKEVCVGTVGESIVRVGENAGLVSIVGESIVVKYCSSILFATNKNLPLLSFIL